MAKTPKNCGFKVGTLDGKRFVGYKIVRQDDFDGHICGLSQYLYRYPDGFVRGKTLFEHGKPVLCQNGWHAWRTAFVARDNVRYFDQYGRSFRLFAVEIWGKVDVAEDKLVGSHMKMLYEIPINWDAKRLLPSRMLTRAWNRYLAKRKGSK